MNICFIYTNLFNEYFLRTPEAKEEWLDALFEATQDYCKKRNTLKILDDPSGTAENIGREKPSFEAYDSVQNCRDHDCFNTFSFFSKGINCRACGKVRKPGLHNIFKINIFIEQLKCSNFVSFLLQIFCKNCIKNKSYLAYMKREGEVCKDCFQILQNLSLIHI